MQTKVQGSVDSRDTEASVDINDTQAGVNTSETVAGVDMTETEAQWLVDYAGLFDVIESTPLTQEQRRACVSDAAATLVLAGAGTGKTSTLTGRVAFLLANDLASPEEILCLAFARAAALEIQDRLHRRLADRLSVDGFVASTFHSLGLQIVTQVEQKRPQITCFCTQPETVRRFLDEQIRQCMERSDDYARLLIEYFASVEPRLSLSGEYVSRDAYLASFASRPLRSLRGELMRNPLECLVANAFSLLGFVYHYLAHYPQEVYLTKRMPYRASFFLPDIHVYVDVFDYVEQNDAPLEVRQLAVRLSDIHHRYGTQYIQLWESSTSAADIGSLIQYLNRTLHQQRGHLNSFPDVPVTGPAVEKANSDANAWWKKSLVSASDCLSMLMGSERWEALLEMLADLLPLYRLAKTRADIVNAGSGTNAWSDPAVERMNRYVLSMLEPLVHAYDAYIRDRGEIDFDGMISRATQYVKEGRFQIPWRDILIDEFQDISSHRYALIAAMLAQQPGIRLFCVGDDWQAIYRFAGSDIRYCTQFGERVHPQFRLIPLSCTFRFNQDLCQISSRFLMKNAFQNSKKLYAVKPGGVPVITIAIQAQGLPSILSRLQEEASKAASVRSDRIDAASNSNAAVCQLKFTVLILARFSHLLPAQSLLTEFGRRYPMLQIQSSTVHASKGLEADYVLILNMEQGVYGFPSEKPIDPVREQFLPPQEDFAFADERRLFYVAMTRARKRLWLLVPDEENRLSIFVTELLKENKKHIRRHDRRSWRTSLSAYRQKLPIARIIHEIKRYVVGLRVGTEKKDRIT